MIFNKSGFLTWQIHTWFLLMINSEEASKSLDKLSTQLPSVDHLDVMCSCIFTLSLPRSLRLWMGEGAGFWRWKVTGLGVRRRELPIFVCTHSVHRGWWPAFEKSPSHPEPSPSPDRTERRGAPSESPISATAGGKKRTNNTVNTLLHASPLYSLWEGQIKH